MKISSAARWDGRAIPELNSVDMKTEQIDFTVVRVEVLKLWVVRDVLLSRPFPRRFLARAQP